MSACYLIKTFPLCLISTIYYRWDDRQPLAQPRCHSNLVVASGYMYLIGGRSQHSDVSSGVTSLSSLEIYNEAADVWEHVADMGIARHDAGCVAIGEFDLVTTTCNIKANKTLHWICVQVLLMSIFILHYIYTPHIDPTG